MKRYLIAILLCSCMFSACDKLLEVDQPAERLVNASVFSSDNTMNAASLGLYSLLRNLEPPHVGNASMYADEFVYNGPNADMRLFASNSLNSKSNFNYVLWRALYFAVYQSNQILEALPNSKNVSDAVKQRARGEALFFRAFAYFHLTNIWGDVPLVTTTRVATTSKAVRVDMDEVLALAEKDLIEAKSVLLTDYEGDEPYRVNRQGATAMLARLYLCQKKWSDAEKESTEIIDSKRYALPAPDSVFLGGSKEVILAAWNQTGFPAIGSVYIPTNFTAAPAYQLSPNLVGSFSQDDKRYASWTKSYVANGVTYSYLTKYKTRTAASGAASEYAVILRLGEQFLIRSEARANLNHFAGAYKDLDTLRRRAGIALLPIGLNKEQLLQQIETARWQELFVEGFHRFFDLKRTGRIDVVLDPVKAGWESVWAVWPIPFDEISRNPLIIQNEDYQ
ncbi:RagB/SusD family nutrient uptake outer membrane protein [Chitinophaga horti]|uniref:RagB/SusD family nutrient uptake outer membrane protein n=1 Tax=Chitinophaga horti TaxID=2920382 RepID=A0ABY6J458_9BACT|nr:RagB/SusD family nutrient uptake outer membrane protein [Chitinophaga horti]UYQ94407.1 RagB/SusD family nutrient uptake outer membrane protein [Chitinophaga horti]